MIDKQYAKVKDHILSQLSLLKKKPKERDRRLTNKNQFYESIYRDQQLGLSREEVITLCTLMTARLRQLGISNGLLAIWETISDGNPMPKILEKQED